MFTEEETENKDNKIWQKVRKLCEGDAEVCIRWVKEMSNVVKDTSCDTIKSKLVMVSDMIYSSMTDTWNENITAITHELVNKVKVEKSGVNTNYKAAQGPLTKAFDIYLINQRERFFDNFAAIKQ